MGLLSLSLLFALSACVVPAAGNTANCPCTDLAGCTRPAVSQASDKEIFAFTDGTGTSPHENWDWSAITTIITTHDYDESNYWVIMCYAHSRKARFGFTKRLTSRELNETTVESWTKKTADLARDTMADLVVLDLIPYFSEQNLTLRDKNGNVTVLVEAVHKLRTKLMPMSSTSSVHIMCIAPWLPPSADKDLGADERKLSKMCDYFLLNPDSFAINFDLSCKARATVPQPRMVISIEEYIALGIDSRRIILGIPWHGYEYRCAKMEQDFCTLDKEGEGDSATCMTQERKKVTLTDIFTKYKNGWAYHNRSRIDGAPFLNSQADGKPLQVWFEDSHSLKIKYHVAHNLDLKGIAIMTAEDLNDFSSPEVIGYDKGMWAWAYQGFLYKSPTRLAEKPIPPGTVAGTAVGCLLAGAFLGVIFSCLAMRRVVTKPRPPFMKDADEYYDEDPNL